MSIETKDYDRAHTYIKEALTSQPHNLELRALYTYFLIETNATKLAHDFTLGTLKDHSRHDLYALCAGGMLNYGRARENKDPSPGAAKDRQLKFFRAAEFYDKALLLDPQCAYAAQGLAISIAEGTLGTGVEARNGTAVTEVAARAKNSRDALTILMKVKDSVNSGSVYVNIGHCHFMREEWERAIESVSFLPCCRWEAGADPWLVQYGTASKRYFNGKNGPTLLYLARSWYHKANKDQSFSDLRQALVHAQAVRSSPRFSPRKTDDKTLCRPSPFNQTISASFSTSPSSSRRASRSSSNFLQTAAPSQSSTSPSPTARTPSGAFFPLVVSPTSLTRHFLQTLRATRQRQEPRHALRPRPPRPPSPLRPRPLPPRSRRPRRARSVRSDGSGQSRPSEAGARFRATATGRRRGAATRGDCEAGTRAGGGEEGDGGEAFRVCFVEECGRE